MTTSRIRILSDQVANQIAAGEVVERPASVLKELVENALDAGATSLEISWEEGGRKLLEVADDGSGMARDDLYLALERHATSKIKSARDLQALDSFGFRGEALPSIASVTRFTLHSAESNSLGYRLQCEFGVIKDVTPAPRARGTTVAIRDIFLQLPARRRFLKSAETEHAHLWATISRLALATSHVRWKIRTDKSGELVLPPVEDLRQRIVPLMGEKMVRLIAFCDGEAPWRINGYVSTPDLSYRDRNHLYLFVNGRPVRDRLMLSALAKGWDGFFPKGSYPVVVLFLEIPADTVDVNVHPTKAEVRFREPQKIFPWISQTTRAAWEAAKGELPSLFAPTTKSGGHGDRHRDAQERLFDNTQQFSSLSRYGGGREALKSLQQAFAPDLDRPYDLHITISSVAEDSMMDTTCRRAIRYLGTFAGTYLLAEFQTDNTKELWIVDQHVAHERVFYEQFFLRKHIPAVQPLLPPKVISIGRVALAALSTFMEELCRIGVEVEPFGEDAVAVRALPDFLSGRDPESLIEDLLSKVQMGDRTDIDYFRKDLNAALACRSAIKKNQALDDGQAQALLEQLMACDTPLTCPHGRPVMKRVTLTELERSFGR